MTDEEREAIEQESRLIAEMGEAFKRFALSMDEGTAALRSQALAFLDPETPKADR